MFETLLTMNGLTLAAFLGATVVLMITPGPGMMFCVACGLAGGSRAGVAAGFGSACGMVVHTGLAAAGVSAVLLAAPGAYDALRYVGAAYLAWLAWSAWRAGDDLEKRLGRRRALGAFWKALLTNILNPKVILFMIAFLPQFVDPAVGPVWRQLLVLGGLTALIGLVFDCAYGGFAGALAARLRRASRFMNRISALVFGGLAARLILD